MNLIYSEVYIFILHLFLNEHGIREQCTFSFFLVYAITTYHFIFNLLVPCFNIFINVRKIIVAFLMIQNVSATILRQPSVL